MVVQDEGKTYLEKERFKEEENTEWVQKNDWFRIRRKRNG